MESGNADVDRLLNRGGILGMMSTSSLALLALGLGEMLQRMGVLSVVLSKMEVLIKSPRSLVITTLGTCLLTTVLTASQYIAILLPGQVMKDAYHETGRCRNEYCAPNPGRWRNDFLLPDSMVHDRNLCQRRPWSCCNSLCALCFPGNSLPLIAVFYALTGIAIFKESKSQ